MPLYCEFVTLGALTFVATDSVRPPGNLVWLDMEMSGLDPETDRVLEIATIVTDAHLNVLAEGPTIAVHQSEAVLQAMDDWNVEHHTASGLVDRVRQSRYTDADAERETLEFLSRYVGERESPLCGNSIGQDRRFIVKYMPRLDAFLHYRNLDVSTVKEIIRRWRPDLYAGLTKQGRHQAIDDVRDSIDELRYYREHFFRMED